MSWNDGSPRAEPRQLKTMPYAPEHERAVLACVLLKPELMRQLKAKLTADMFFVVANRMVWEAFSALHEAETPIDIMTTLGALESAGADAKSFGMAGLAELDEHLPDLGRWEAYAEPVRQAYRRRRTWSLAQALAAARDEATDLEALLAGAVTELDDVVEMAPGMAAKSLEDVMVAAMPPLPGAKPVALPLFCPELSRYRLLRPGRLIVLAGRPGHGKSALALTIVDHVAHVLGERVLHLSLEMTAEELAERLLCGRNRIDYTSYQDGAVSDAERERVATDANVITDAERWVIRDRATHDTVSAVSAIRHEHARSPLSLVLIDYLGLIQLPGDDEVAGLGEIARTMKNLSVELGLPVVLLHQMNRRIYSRPGWNPELADLRGSGKIEEHADAVLFITSPWRFDKEKSGPGEEVDDTTKDEVFVHVRKNRGGLGFGDVPLYFFAETMTIAPVERWRKEPWESW